MSDYSTRCPHVFQGDRCIDRLGHSGKHTNKFGPEGFFWDDFHSHEILYVAERAYTQAELNAAIAEAVRVEAELQIEHANKRVEAERDELNAALVAMVDAMESVSSTVEFYLKREINSPSNHQEFAREAQEKLDKFNAAKRLPAETVASVERERRKLQLEARHSEANELKQALRRLRSQREYVEWAENRVAALEAELNKANSAEGKTAIS